MRSAYNVYLVLTLYDVSHFFIIPADTWRWDVLVSFTVMQIVEFSVIRWSVLYVYIIMLHCLVTCRLMQVSFLYCFLF